MKVNNFTVPIPQFNHSMRHVYSLSSTFLAIRIGLIITEIQLLWFPSLTSISAVGCHPKEIITTVSIDLVEKVVEPIHVSF